MGDWTVAEARLMAETRRIREMLTRDLRALGVADADALLERHEWARLAQGLVYVEDERRRGGVRNPAGLLVWWLKRFG